jgi:hypothetical protein
MSKPTALLCDSAELVPVAVATTAISQDISRVPAQTLQEQVPSQELVAVPVLAEAVSAGFNPAAALLVERDQQHAISVPVQTTSHETARLKQ